MCVGIVNQADEILSQKEIPPQAELFVETLAPYREDVVVSVECLFTWDWLADLCAAHKIPCVLGHALSMKVIHGSKTQHDRSDSKKLAQLLRAGMIPMADVSPKPMRSTRDRRRRRMHFVRERADVLPHLQQTNDQSNLPPLGKPLTYQGTRKGVVERFDDDSARKTVEPDPELIASDETMIRTLEWPLVRSANAHDPQTLQSVHTMPGIGKMLSLVMLYEIQDISRFPNIREFASYARVIRPKKTSAGKSSGSSNGRIGKSDLKWACSEAVIVFLRETREAHPDIRRLERKYGQDKATGIVAHRRGRTGSSLLKKTQGVAMTKFVTHAAIEHSGTKRQSDKAPLSRQAVSQEEEAAASRDCRARIPGSALRSTRSERMRRERLREAGS